MYTAKNTCPTIVASLATVLTLALAAPLAVPAEPILMDDGGMGSSAESLFGTKPAEKKDQAIQPETVVAKVDGEEIMFADLQQRLQAVMGNIPPNIPPEVIQQQIPKIMTEALNGIMVERLVEKAVEDEDITVSSEEVDEQLEQIRTQIPEGQDLEELLASQNTTLETLKERIESELAANKLIEQNVEFEDDVTEEEIKEFYENNPQQFVKPELVAASHILIGFEEDDDDAAKEAKLDKIKELRAKIIAEDITFEEAALDNSTCPSAQQGGSLGSFKRGQMVPAFEEVAFTQELGELSEPVETEFGYHIIKVSERSEEQTMPLEEVSENIENYLVQSARQQKVQEYISSLREDADVEVLVDLSKIKFSQTPTAE